MYNPFSLNGKTILVTGASSGIGRAVSIECSKLGAKVLITGRNQERLNDTYNHLEGNGHIAIPADLTIYSDMEKIVALCPNLDGFVNNAGITKVLFVKSIRKEFLERFFKNYTISPIFLKQIVIKKKCFEREIFDRFYIFT